MLGDDVSISWVVDLSGLPSVVIRDVLDVVVGVVSAAGGVVAVVVDGGVDV